MKIVFISDTHNQHLALDTFMPEGDVLVHAGDLTGTGTLYELQRALDWLDDQPYEHVLFIAGNHDFGLEAAHKKDLLNFGRLIYLENSGREIDGVRFWGSPITPQFFDWAFMQARGKQIAKTWAQIPTGTDVLITHGPPMGSLDKTAPQYGAEHVGCEDLAKKVDEIQPQIHVFGHIHGGYGRKQYRDTLYINASIVDEGYRPVNAPITEEANVRLQTAPLVTPTFR